MKKKDVPDVLRLITWMRDKCRPSARKTFKDGHELMMAQAFEDALIDARLEDQVRIASLERAVQDSY